MMRLSRRRLLRSATMVSLGAAIAGCTRQAAATEPAASATIATAVPATAAAVPTTDAAATMAATAAPAATTVVPAATAVEATATAAPAAEAAVQEYGPEGVVLDGVPEGAAYMAIVHGEDAEAMVGRAIEMLGGIGRFVQQGYDVIIKPNICNPNYDNEYASTTNPEVVAALVKLCLGAGAKRVRVMDLPFEGTCDQAYFRSGIQAAVEAAGGEMEIMAPHKYVEVAIPGGQDLKSWEFYQPVLDADLLINVPIPKDHQLARLTLSAKNLMGVISTRGAIHQNLNQRIAEIASVVRPQLTVMDAIRILTANGPTGGNLADVKQTNMIIASHDMVAIDAYATSLFDMVPDDIGYIAASARLGLGTSDLSRIQVEETNV